jgi:predicted ATPase
MIDQVRLYNFKCFEALELDLAPLTLLTGFNAGGKSTTTQALLLLAQTLRGARENPGLLLNGSVLSLGTPVDVLNANGSAKTLTLGAASGEIRAQWHFVVPVEDRRLLRVERVDVQDGDGAESMRNGKLDGLRPEWRRAHELLSQIESLIYLSAARQVETEVFPSPFDPGLPVGDVGAIGQYATWWLREMGDQESQAKRMHVEATNQMSIRQQVNAWIGDLFPGAEANALQLAQTNLMQLQLRSGITSNWVRPANIGYGISYAFPIVVAGLCAEVGRTIILDSPEAHLHPRAQSRVGRFLSQMANAGVQMLVETHSDHVLNGVRIAVKEGVIRPEDTAVYFFTGKPDARVIRLSVDRNGTVHDLPEGFFDQAELDLANLAGWTL